MPDHKIEVLEKECYGEAADILARAFQEDPIWSRLLPDDAARQAQLTWLFRAWIKVLAPLNTSCIVRNAAVAQWIPPGRKATPSVFEVFNSGLAWAPLHLGIMWLLHGVPVQLDLMRRQRAFKQPCWQLDVLGVVPEHQRTGVGSALVEHGLQKTDSDHLPAYVITHNPINVAFYERFGFEVIDMRSEDQSGFFACSFKRPPR